jgi:GTP-binding protein YchF
MYSTCAKESRQVSDTIRLMSLSVAIVGLPNVGKSTLFNALLKKQQALAANYPFATIEPNVGIVAVPDERLQKLAVTIAESKPNVAATGSKETFSPVQLPPVVPAMIEFVDVAGLVQGAHKGEGLGNQFLSHIRECSAIAFVVRAFADADVIETGSQNVGDDLTTVKQELIFKDLETIEAQKIKLKKQNSNPVLKLILEKLELGFNEGKLASQILSSAQLAEIADWCLLSAKPSLYVVNVGEQELAASESTVGTGAAYASRLQVEPLDVVVVCAKVEADLAQLPLQEQAEYMASLNISTSGISALAGAAYAKLGLMSFLTAGEKEIRAWTIPMGTSAPKAAGVIHTDFEQKFIKAEVINWQVFIEVGGWKKARELGKVRLEGRDYVMQEGDVVDFKIGA